MHARTHTHTHAHTHAHTHTHTHTHTYTNGKKRQKQVTNVINCCCNDCVHACCNILRHTAPTAWLTCWSDCRGVLCVVQCVNSTVWLTCWSDCRGVVCVVQCVSSTAWLTCWSDSHGVLCVAQCQFNSMTDLLKWLPWCTVCYAVSVQHHDWLIEVTAMVYCVLCSVSSTAWLSCWSDCHGVLCAVQCVSSWGRRSRTTLASPTLMTTVRPAPVRWDMHSPVTLFIFGLVLQGLCITSFVAAKGQMSESRICISHYKLQ